MKTVRLYGHFRGNSSLCRVSQGFQSVFKDAHLFDIDEHNIRNELDDIAASPAGVDADVGIFVGNLSQLQVISQLHKKLFVMVAPNSDKIGSQLETTLRNLDCTLLAPSTWALSMLQGIFGKKEILRVPHGVLTPSNYYPFTAKSNKTKLFKVLHLSSSMLDRKGTRTLLKAWDCAYRFLKEKDPTFIGLLDIVLPREMFSDYSEEVSENVRFIGTLDDKIQNMFALYRSYSWVCQPSRSEAFGLVPLESVIAGTKVIITEATGHLEYISSLEDAVIRVPMNRFDQAIDDFPGAIAPTYDWEVLADALITASYQNGTVPPVLREAVKEQWSWENCLSSFKERVYT